MTDTKTTNVGLAEDAEIWATEMKRSTAALLDEGLTEAAQGSAAVAKTLKHCADALRKDQQDIKATISDQRCFQDDVADWMQICFGSEIRADKLERNDRFCEESLELLQSLNMPKERILALVDYVYGRDAGEPAQEIGGVMVTLAALCSANHLNMDSAAQAELTRINDPAIVEKIRKKQAAKPTGSALPVADKQGSLPKALSNEPGVEEPPHYRNAEVLADEQEKYLDYHLHQANTYMVNAQHLTPEKIESLNFHIHKLHEAGKALTAALATAAKITSNGSTLSVSSTWPHISLVMAQSQPKTEGKRE